MIFTQQLQQYESRIYLLEKYVRFQQTRLVTQRSTYNVSKSVRFENTPPGSSAKAFLDKCLQKNR